MEVLARILQIKNDSNMSDVSLEEKLGLKPKTVSNWKRGKSTSYLQLLPNIAALFHVSTDYLLGVEDAKKDGPQGPSDNGIVLGYNSGVYRPGVDELPKNPIDLLKDVKSNQGKQDPYSDLTAYEKDILEAFRSLDIKNQARLITLIHEFVDSIK